MRRRSRRIPFPLWSKDTGSFSALRRIRMTSNPLQKPVQFVKGIGPALAGKLARLGVHTVEDLLYLLPNRYTDRRQICSVGQASPGKEQVVLGMVIRAGVSFMGRKKKKIFEAVIEDAAGQLTAR